MKAAAMRYADLLENGCFITHHEQDEIAKLLRRLVMTEDEAWNELERKQNKKTQTTKVDWEAVAADQAMTIALAQPEQKPVAWLEYDDEGYLFLSGKRKGAFPVFIAPPSKPWVSLTDEELVDAYGLSKGGDYTRFARAIEAKLKEKNND